MKIDFTSDLHLDFWIKPHFQGAYLENAIKHFTHNVICANGGDVLIIAGDLGEFFHQNSTFLLYVKSIYSAVFVVRGNHDLYLTSNSQKEKYDYCSWNRVKEMKQFCSENSINYLDGDVVTVDGVRFGGVGMSWDDSFLMKMFNMKVSNNNIMRLFKDKLNDYKYILEGKGFVVPVGMYGSTYNVERFNPFKLFREEKDKLENIVGADVMISHYGPIIPRNLPIEHQMSKETTFFYFDGEYDLERINPEIWIFGHTHHQYNFRKFRTDLFCSPLGYPGKDTQMGSVRTIEI